MWPAGHDALPDLRPLPGRRTWPEPSPLTFMRGSLQRRRCRPITHRYVTVWVSDNRSVTFMASSTYAKSVRCGYAAAEPATSPASHAEPGRFRTSVADGGERCPYA